MTTSHMDGAHNAETAKPMDTWQPSAETTPAVPFALAVMKLANTCVPFRPAERALPAPTLPFDVQIAIHPTKQLTQIVQNE